MWGGETRQGSGILSAKYSGGYVCVCENVIIKLILFAKFIKRLYMKSIC